MIERGSLTCGDGLNSGRRTATRGTHDRFMGTSCSGDTLRDFLEDKAPAARPGSSGNVDVLLTALSRISNCHTRQLRGSDPLRACELAVSAITQSRRLSVDRSCVGMALSAPHMASATASTTSPGRRRVMRLPLSGLTMTVPTEEALSNASNLSECRFLG
jgi:hypothetical protein